MVVFAAQLASDRHSVEGDVAGVVLQTPPAFSNAMSVEA